MQLIFIISLVLLFAYTILILYFRNAWVSLPSYTASDTPFSTAITIIIPARNEEKNIAACLQSIINQDFPAAQLQVIVVNDHSGDNTASIAESYSGKNVQLINLSDHISQEINSYKKKAIEVALTISTGELIVCTDADCIMPSLWLQTIVSFYNEKDPKLIVMPVIYKTGVTALGIFQSLDFISLQGITGAAVGKKVLSMCNGANLAYSKAAFYEVGGFAGIDSIASGDDMLLMHKIAQKFPGDIHFLRSPDVIVQTDPMHTLGDFFNQRIRWASKADKYDDKRIFAVLLIVYFLNVALLLLPFICIIKNPIFSFHISPLRTRFSLLEGWIFLMACKTLTELFFLYPVATFFGKRNLLWLFPVAQPFHITYTIIAGWLGKFGSYHWKGRKVK